MFAVEYEYELRAGAEVLSTGHLGLANAPSVGDVISVGGRGGVVRDIIPGLRGSFPRLILQLNLGESSFSVLR